VFENDMDVVNINTKRKLKKLQSSINVFEFRSLGQGQRVPAEKHLQLPGVEEVMTMVKKPSNMRLPQSSGKGHGPVKRAVSSINMF
jgi:hypothetical protein